MKCKHRQCFEWESGPWEQAGSSRKAFLRGCRAEGRTTSQAKSFGRRVPGDAKELGEMERARTAASGRESRERAMGLGPGHQGLTTGDCIQKVISRGPRRRGHLGQGVGVQREGRYYQSPRTVEAGWELEPWRRGSCGYHQRGKDSWLLPPVTLQTPCGASHWVTLAEKQAIWKLGNRSLWTSLFISLSLSFFIC